MAEGRVVMELGDVASGVLGQRGAGGTQGRAAGEGVRGGHAGSACARQSCAG